MSQSHTIVKPFIFREYIGVKPYPHIPTEIFNIKIQEFHFILGFATENCTDGTGCFTPNWNLEYFSPDKVASLKKKFKKRFPEVKVIISIGGCGKDHEFNPQDKEKWIETAVRTIRVILEDYKVEDNYTIDGIDINYEFVNPQVDVEVFSFCIGSVIKKLKEANVNVNVVSIAPSACVQPFYKQLYSDYQNFIDLVGYQFYNQKVCQVKEFVNLYNSLVSDYEPGVVLAGDSSDPDNKNNIPPEIFLEGCKILICEGKLRGIFIWYANDLFPDYTLEREAQEILAP